MKVFLDANILFSSSVEQSRIRKLVNIIQNNGTCITNSYAIEEAKRNITAKKFGSMEQLEFLLLEKITINNSLILDLPVTLREKDIPILAGAIAVQCTHLLTGDKKDFGFLFGESISGVKIVSPQLMASELVDLGLIKEKN
ncbi:MAG: PIN domain-containing protein [Crocosphaera sp.]|nr:PIN domain-containing protein [Crocosphaera sp.]